MRYSIYNGYNNCECVRITKENRLATNESTVEVRLEK